MSLKRCLSKSFDQIGYHTNRVTIHRKESFILFFFYFSRRFRVFKGTNPSVPEESGRKDGVDLIYIFSRPNPLFSLP